MARAVYCEETGANGDPMCERDRAEGIGMGCKRNDREEGIMGG